VGLILEMADFGVFLYAMLTMFVLLSIERDRKLAKPSHQMMTMVGWGLFSLSSTLAVLMTGLAVALALGFNVPVAGMDAGLFG